ncbi:MAG: hypothetical protein IJR88_03465 [Clostridia bacterium]|nr:hypothetical protein [Clostridia bacterium]
MQKTKTLNLILRITALALIAISFLLLFIPYQTTYKTSSWGVSTSTKSRIDVDSQKSYSSHNFFGCTEKLKDEGWEIGTHVILLIAIALSVVALVLSFFVDFFKGFWMAVLPLIVVVFCIVISVRLQKSSFGIEGPTYLGSLYGYMIYKDKMVHFGVSLIPSMFAAFFAFGASLTAGIFHFISKRKAANAVESVPATTETQVATEPPVVIETSATPENQESEIKTDIQ